MPWYKWLKGRQEIAREHSPNASNGFWDGKGGRGDDGAGWLVGEQLEDHQAPVDDLTPAALVLGFRDPVVPECLGVMLLRVKDFASDVRGDVVGDVVAEDKGDGLSLLEVDMGHDAFAE